MKKPIYLDYAAATPVDAAVLAAMRPYFADEFYNPSARYQAARQITRDIEAARGKIAHWLGARGNEIVFTAGGTEANNLAIAGIMSRLPDGNMVVSAIEHPSVMEPARRYENKVALAHAQGIVDITALEKLIDDRTVLVSIMYANNEIGTVQPIRQVAKIINNKRKERQQKFASNIGHPTSDILPLYLHVDAAQAAAYLDLHVSRLGVDLMTVNSGKIYGPKQCGALYIRSGVALEPLIRGGGQEQGRRSGTENAAHIVGFAAALDLVQNNRQEETRRLQALQTLFFELLAERLPTAVVNGSRKHRLPNNVHLTIPQIDNERLIMELDARGILCAAGSACSAAGGKASAVLSAIGLDETTARSSIRFTMGRGTTEQEVRQTVLTLAELVRP